MRILVVEDDLKIASFIKRGLIQESYSVDLADDGKEALILALANHYGIILLDIMLPYINGIDVCKILRDNDIKIPIILLTARDNLQDKIKGLDSGANDYLTKPFEFDELLARIRAQLRVSGKINKTISIGDLVIDMGLRELKIGKQKIKLTAKEYSLLEFLAINKNKIVTQKMILKKLDDFKQLSMNNVVSVYIYRLRSKIEEYSSLNLIKTIRGAGYKLMDENV